MISLRNTPATRTNAEVRLAKIKAEGQAKRALFDAKVNRFWLLDERDLMDCVLTAKERKELEELRKELGYV